MSAFWKIAVIGSGPAGFYAAGELFRQQSWSIKVDMFDRLPTPFGLVRGGVAPDHQKIKSVTKIYSRIAENENFRFFGNVEFGSDILRSDVLEFYDAVIYAVGSPSDRSLGIPGEELPGSHSATEFVAWYNGHPDFRGHKFDLSVKDVFVIAACHIARGGTLEIIGKEIAAFKEIKSELKPVTEHDINTNNDKICLSLII